MEIILKKQNKQKLGSSLGFSRFQSNKKPVSKLSLYETNLENYNSYNETNKFGTEKIDPKGIPASGIYASFSGVIQSLELFSDDDIDLQVYYEIKIGKQWHDQTPQVNDSIGHSNFASSKNGEITFSLGFDTLISCMYIESWPQLLLTIRGFDMDGDLITKGYAQIYLPTQSGMQIKQAAVYQIFRNVKWYHKWLPFLEPTTVSYDPKQFERIIEKGEGRETQKVRCIGKIKIRTEVLLRNFNRYGYQ